MRRSLLAPFFASLERRALGPLNARCRTLTVRQSGSEKPPPIKRGSDLSMRIGRTADDTEKGVEESPHSGLGLGIWRFRLGRTANNKLRDGVKLRAGTCCSVSGTDPA